MLNMKEKTYIKQLEDRLYELMSILTDHNLYSFLSDGERKKLGAVLTKAAENKKEFADSKRM
jgi:hypothetical protein